MATPAQVEQVVQWGRETTPFTPVAAIRRLPSVGVTFDLDALRQTFRAMGYNADTINVPNGFWAPGSYESPVDFNQAAFILDSLVGATPTTPSGGTNSRQWDFAPSSTAADTAAKHFTIEVGDSNRAFQYAGVRARSLQLAISRTGGAFMRGALAGRWPTVGTLTTASVTSIAQRPATGVQWDVFFDTTYPGIGVAFSTQITDAFNATFNLGNVFDPFWALTTATTSPKDYVSIAREISGAFSTAFNAQAASLFSGIQANAVGYLRLQATGAVIEGVISELFRLDMACIISRAARAGDPVYGYEYGLSSVYDSTLGGHWKARIINALTTTG